MNSVRRMNASHRPALAWIAAGLSSLLLQLHGGAPPVDHLQSVDPTPFLNLRQSTLAYHGPSTDLTNLTELRIGWFGPTNLDDPLHGDLWWAANYAVGNANASIPISDRKSQISSPPLPSSPSASLLPFRLISRWSVDPWGTGVSQLTRMVYEDEPLAVLGSVDSASTHLAEQVVAKANLPLVSPIATDKSVTLAGVSWMFACAPTDVAVARALVGEILQCAGEKARADDESGVRGQPPLAVLTATDHESRMTAREVFRELSRRQRPPDFRHDLSTHSGALEHLLSTLAEIKPRIILIIAGAEDAARLVRAIRDERRPWSQALSSTAILGSQAMARTLFLELAGTAAEGVRFPLPAVPDADDAVTRDFIQRFTAERGHRPDYAAILTYDATRLLLDAIQETGPNRSRIRNALAGLSPWTGIGGSICFDGTGQNTRTNIPLATIRAGRVTALSDLPRTACPR
jgi:branched-chain amino acid transport system substrate-binding protein